MSGESQRPTVAEHTDLTELGRVSRPCQQAVMGTGETSARYSNIPNETGWSDRSDPTSQGPAADLSETRSAIAAHSPLFRFWGTLTVEAVKLSRSREVMHNSSATVRPSDRGHSNHWRFRHHPDEASETALASTASSMGSVNRPVKVFCWLTW